jgi:hypothetical protein
MAVRNAVMSGSVVWGMTVFNGLGRISGTCDSYEMLYDRSRCIFNEPSHAEFKIWSKLLYTLNH